MTAMWIVLVIVVLLGLSARYAAGRITNNLLPQPTSRLSTQAKFIILSTEMVEAIPNIQVLEIANEKDANFADAEIIL